MERAFIGMTAFFVPVSRSGKVKRLLHKCRGIFYRMLSRLRKSRRIIFLRALFQNWQTPEAHLFSSNFRGKITENWEAVLSDTDPGSRAAEIIERDHPVLLLTCRHDPVELLGQYTLLKNRFPFYRLSFFSVLSGNCCNLTMQAICGSLP